uniref:DNA ligase 1 n=2 Tax=Vitis vinifera TaxID=29760 RepID=F6HKA7_VITVI
MSALHQIREKSQKDGQKKNEETISSLSTEMKSMIDDLKSKLEKERQSFAKALSKSSKECENSLKIEAARFQEVYEKFSKERSAHLQAFQGKKEKTMISEHEKACADKIARLEESLKKKKQDDKTFNILRKTLGSFLGNGSDEDFPPDD